MNFTKTISTELDNLTRRIIKIVRYGKSDVQTPMQVAPHGIDSNPVMDLIALYAETGEKGKAVIIGYLNRNVLAAVGETRIYSTNADGELSTYVWLKANETIEIGGNVDNMVRFSDLKDGFDQLTSDLNDLKTKWNNFTAVYAPGGPANVGLPATLAGQDSPASTASIDAAKIEEIKTL